MNECKKFPGVFHYEITGLCTEDFSTFKKGHVNPIHAVIPYPLYENHAYRAAQLRHSWGRVMENINATDVTCDCADRIEKGLDLAYGLMYVKEDKKK